MREMSVRELRDSLSSLGDIVERDGEIVLTRHGRPVAKVVPINPTRTAPSHAGLRAGMARMEVGSEVLVKADREGLAEPAREPSREPSPRTVR